jgi:ATP-binding cassette subfamily B protein
MGDRSAQAALARRRWTELAQAAALRWSILRICGSAGVAVALAAAALVAIDGAAAGALLLASARAIAAIPAAARSDSRSSADAHVLLLVSAAAGAYLVQQLVAAGAPLVGGMLARRVDGDARDRAAAAAAAASTAALEDPPLVGLLTEATQALEYAPYTPGAAAGGLLALARHYAQAGAAAVLVAIYFSPLAGIALVVATWVLRRGVRSALVQYAATRGRTLSTWREAWYFRRLGLEPSAAKELRIFGLVDWVRARHRRAVEAALAVEWPVRRRVHGAAMIWRTAAAAGITALVLVALAESVASGRTDLQALALLLVAAIAVLRTGIFFHDADFPIEFGMRAIDALQAYEAAAAPASVDASARTPPPALQETIRFVGVGFAYPGSDRRVLESVDLEIPIGRSLAIVGLNGAGKTTIVKLLARLYEPDAGRITVDGHDLRGYDRELWQRRIAVIFQDFMRYELSLRDNIRLGAPERLADDAAVAAVADRAGLAELVDSLPRGLATVLSPRYDGGVDLSGGEWQRVALARALFAVEAGADVVVLDEPTASLDVRAEAVFFERFERVTERLTTIIVSHRFSTVRHADAIAVVEDGRIAEYGAHDELVALGGRYAKLFATQRMRFVDAAYEGVS